MKWVDCKESLPDEHSVVAVLFSDGEFGVAWATYWHGASSDFAGWVFPLDELGEGREVAYWTALPPSPGQVPE